MLWTVASEGCMTTADQSAQQRYAAARWAELRGRLRTVTPRAVGRSALALAVLAGAGWLIRETWPAFLPFVVGGLIAYQLLPVVDALDRMMPRFVASIVTVVGAVAAVVAIAVLLLPPLAAAFVRFAGELPTQAEIQAAIDRLQGQLGSLPEGSAAVVIPALASLAGAVRDIFGGASVSLDDVVRGAVGALLNAVGALLGLIVLPAWMLTVMSQKRRAQLAIDSEITPSLRRDVWAVAAIVDRAAGSYLRGYVVTAIFVGLLTYLFASLLPRLGGPTFAHAGTVAVFAGAVQVVPIVGPILGLLPAVLVAPVDTNLAVAYVGVYLLARLVGGTLLGGRIQQRRLGVHPAILVPGVVMVGQFGPFWLLLSAPIVAIAVDLVKYVHGRLSEPPRPAGVLPGQPVPVAASTGGAPTVAPVPATYRPARAPMPIARAAAAVTVPVVAVTRRVLSDGR
jgi:predicted PurR-regulated permease PerM